MEDSVNQLEVNNLNETYRTQRPLPLDAPSEVYSADKTVKPESVEPEKTTCTVTQTDDTSVFESLPGQSGGADREISSKLNKDYISSEANRKFVVDKSSNAHQESISVPSSEDSAIDTLTQSNSEKSTKQNIGSANDMTSQQGSVNNASSQSVNSVGTSTSQNVDSVAEKIPHNDGSANDVTSQNVVSSPQNTESASSVTPSYTVESTSTKSSSVRRSDIEPGTKKRKRRGSAWSDEQTEFLMEIWARHVTEHKESDDINHNAPVYRLIAKAMGEQGNTKTWEQCKTRIHTLKRAYKLTRDEIKAGATNITYCRHFEKLEIIMGDNETTTPQMLADLLELRRNQNRDNTGKVQTPQKRKLAPSDKPIKRANTQCPDNNLPAPQYTPTQQAGDAIKMESPTPINYTQASPQTHYGLQTQTLQQISPQQQENTTQHVQLSGDLRSYPSATLPPPPPYQPMPATTMNFNHVLGSTPEINNNEVVIKREKPANEGVDKTLSTITAQTWTVPHTPQKEELEKMRLDLELRKIEMERNRLEMEERQRREERDHQYRMLQLLMFGLGQQSSAHVSSGQAAEQVVQAQNSTNLSRALENGLVPGGPHTANEKGLSFSEI